jgi:hypothetical protein
VKISNELREQVRTFERDIRSKSDEAARTAQESKRVQAEANRLWGTMNFRERNLGGWFGGDKTKVARHRELQTKVSELDSKASDLRSEVKKFDAQAKKAIDNHLREHDRDYQELLQPHDEASKVKKAVDAFLGKIDNALSEIDDAQGMETLDLFTKNKGISVLSYMENSEASDAVEAVQQAAKPFQKAVDAYNGFLKGYQAPQVHAEIGDGIDLVFDFVFDGFDFMSIFTLSALSDAEDSLEEARGKVAEVDKIVSGHLDKTSKAVLAYVHSARVACA